MTVDPRQQLPAFGQGAERGRLQFQLAGRERGAVLVIADVLVPIGDPIGGDPLEGVVGHDVRMSQGPANSLISIKK